MRVRDTRIKRYKILVMDNREHYLVDLDTQKFFWFFPYFMWFKPLRGMEISETEVEELRRGIKPLKTQSAMAITMFAPVFTRVFDQRMNQWMRYQGLFYWVPYIMIALFGLSVPIAFLYRYTKSKKCLEELEIVATNRNWVVNFDKWLVWVPEEGYEFYKERCQKRLIILGFVVFMFGLALLASSWSAYVAGMMGYVLCLFLTMGWSQQSLL